MKMLGLDISRVSKRETEPEEPQLRARVQRLEIDLAELAERLVTLEGHFNKLRGIVHGDRGAKVAKPGLQSIPFGDKAALRAALGVNGGRYDHKEE